MQDWHIWAWVASAAVPIGLAVGVSLNWPGRFGLLPIQHVVAATIVALLGWDALANAPTAIAGFHGSGTLVAGPGRGIFAVAQVAFIGAHAVGAIGLLRRHRWAAVLGMGLCAVHVGWSISAIVEMLLSYPDIFDSDPGLLLTLAVFHVAAIVPPGVAIALIVWPAYSLRKISSVPARGGDQAETDAEPAGRRR